MPRRKPPFTQKLSPTERREYEDLLQDAGYDEFGMKRPSGDIADRMHAALESAFQAGRKWAEWALDDDARDGHLKRFTKWESTKHVVQTVDGDRIVTKRAIMGLRRRDPETGAYTWVGAAWEVMDAEEVEQVILFAEKRIRAERVTVGTGKRLRRLMAETRTRKVRDALDLLGMTIDEALTVELAA